MTHLLYINLAVNCFITGNHFEYICKDATRLSKILVTLLFLLLGAEILICIAIFNSLKALFLESWLANFTYLIPLYMGRCDDLLTKEGMDFLEQKIIKTKKQEKKSLRERSLIFTYKYVKAYIKKNNIDKNWYQTEPIPSPEPTSTEPIKSGDIVSFKGLWEGEVDIVHNSILTIKGNGEGFFMIESFEKKETFDKEDLKRIFKRFNKFNGDMKSLQRNVNIYSSDKFPVAVHRMIVEAIKPFSDDKEINAMYKMFITLVENKIGKIN